MKQVATVASMVLGGGPLLLFLPAVVQARGDFGEAHEAGDQDDDRHGEDDGKSLPQRALDRVGGHTGAKFTPARAVVARRWS